MKELPGLYIAIEGSWIVLSWAMDNGGKEAVLQWTEGIGEKWIDVPSQNLDFGGEGRLYKENLTENTRLYRLIKK